MKKFLSILGVVAVIAGFAMIAPDVLAQPTGGSIDTNVQQNGAAALGGIASLFSSNIVLAIGLAIGLFGLYSWLIQQNTWGLVILAGGVILTAFPGIFEGLVGGSTAFIAEFVGDDAQSTVTSRADDIIN